MHRQTASMMKAQNWKGNCEWKLEHACVWSRQTYWGWIDFTLHGVGLVYISDLP